MSYQSKDFQRELPAVSGMSSIDGRHAKDLVRIIRARQRRQDFFPAHLFFDPAWDILLALALANLEQHRVTVSELCTAACAPYTTALRYIQAMIDLGLVVSRDDPLDGRRRFLSMSADAAKCMSAYLNTQPLAEIKVA